MKNIFLIRFTIALICTSIICLSIAVKETNHRHHRDSSISNQTLSGISYGCKHKIIYETSSHVHFDMCIGQTDQDLKNGMAVINLITSRGYLPTCRILQLLLWMSSEVRATKKISSKEIFVDIGANIGSCSTHMASLGLHVLSVEPVIQHVQTIQGSMDLNPSFQINLIYAGISHINKLITPIFYQGARNWGATILKEVIHENFTAEFPLYSLQHIINTKDISLLKIDCEGCEWAALKGAKSVLHKIPIIKFELVENEYKAGNETVSYRQIFEYLQQNNFNLYIDHSNEAPFYFGKNLKEIIETDYMFGNSRFNLLNSNISFLNYSAQRILKSEINLNTFDLKLFKKCCTDIIAIEKELSQRMKSFWL